MYLKIFLRENMQGQSMMFHELKFLEEVMIYWQQLVRMVLGCDILGFLTRKLKCLNIIPWKCKHRLLSGKYAGI